MNTNKSLFEILIALVVVIILAGGAVAIFSPGLNGNESPKVGNVLSVVVPKVSSQSTVAVGPQQVITLSASTTNCTARVISTASTSLMLSFANNGFTPTVSKGTWQGASTTVVYENALYGCGQISAYASGSSTVTVTTLTQ